MTTSERIRAAALGPAPDVNCITDWLGNDIGCQVFRQFLCGEENDGFYNTRSNNLRRMFLLFVAEAVK